jgi:hypothetical protein
MSIPRALRPLLLLILTTMLALLVAACQPVGGVALPGAPPAIAEPTLRPEEVVPPLPTTGPNAVTPVQLQIPAIQLDVPVVPMGWTVTNGGDLSVEWVLPTNAAGWHVTSAPAGGPGNTVISGSQFEGDAVFAPLALGDVALGQEVLLTDSAGATFAYEITQVPEPLPIRGADAGADATARALVEQAGVTRLTLITGWPSFTTTHRQFVVAEFVGEQP